MKNIIKYIFLFHLLMFCAWAYPSTYTLRGLSVSDGLSDLLVNAIYKDSLGFVWIGTGNSLERFDGSHIKHYPITGSNEKLKRVNVIAEMEDNQLWMGNGIVAFEQRIGCFGTYCPRYDKLCSPLFAS